MTVTRITSFKARDDKTAELKEFLHSIVTFIEEAPGNVYCQILQNQERLNEFLCIEEWDSISAHQSAAKDIPPEKLELVMTLLAAPPSGSYFGS